MAQPFKSVLLFITAAAAIPFIELPVVLHSFLVQPVQAVTAKAKRLMDRKGEAAPHRGHSLVGSHTELYLAAVFCVAVQRHPHFSEADAI